MTGAWMAEFGPKGSNVNAIAPQLVLTPGIEGAREAIERIARTLPARRAGSAAEIAAAALYLASGEADFVQGVTLPVDGGYLAI